MGTCRLDETLNHTNMGGEGDECGQNRIIQTQAAAGTNLEPATSQRVSVMGSKIDQKSRGFPISLPFPPDPRQALRRIHAHLVAPRLSGEEYAAIVKAMGYGSIYDFAADYNLPKESVEDWRNVGMSYECAQLLRGIAELKMNIRDTVVEFDSYTHVGLEEFFKDRKII